MRPAPPAQHPFIEFGTPDRQSDVSDKRYKEEQYGETKEADHCLDSVDDVGRQQKRGCRDSDGCRQAQPQLP